MAKGASPRRPFNRGDIRSTVQPSGIQPSNPDSSTANILELGYPTGYNPMCPTCSFLSTKYGPDDGEFILHCHNYFNNPDYLTDSHHYYPGDAANPNLHEFYAAG